MYLRLTAFPQELVEADRLATQWVRCLPRPKDIERILVVGMGGSAIAGDLLATVAERSSRFPISVVRDYRIPAWVDRRTFVVASSYSGFTEETLAAYREATRHRAQIACLSTGGELIRIASRAGHPSLRLPAGFPPRTALAYLLLPLLRLAEAIGALSQVDAAIEEAYRVAGRVLMLSRIERNGRENLAKAIALRFTNADPVVYATSAVAPSGYRWQTQVNENAKTFCAFGVFPELDHNVLTAYGVHPHRSKRNEIVILTEKNPPTALARRVQATAKLMRSASRTVTVHPAAGLSPLAQLISHICLGDWVSYYLALSRNVDPTPVEVIEHLKRLLARSR